MAETISCSKGVRVPEVDLEAAVRLYYTKPALTNDNIRELFRTTEIGSTRMQSLKRVARAKTLELGKLVYNPHYVNTDCAYLAWGLDIKDMERRYKAAEKYGFIPSPCERVAQKLKENEEKEKETEV